MARTVLTKTTAPGSYSHTGTKLTLSGADTSNKNKFIAGGTDIIVAQNTDGSAQTVTITSTLDPYNRDKDIETYNIPAGEIHIFGPFSTRGWQQSDGYIYLEASSANVNFGIIKQ
jgi:hypothetical protein